MVHRLHQQPGSPGRWPGGWRPRGRWPDKAGLCIYNQMMEVDPRDGTVPAGDGTKENGSMRKGKDQGGGNRCLISCWPKTASIQLHRFMNIDHSPTTSLQDSEVPDIPHPLVIIIYHF